MRQADQALIPHIALQAGYASEQEPSKAFACQYATAPGLYRRHHPGT